MSNKDGGAAFAHQELNADGTHHHTHSGLTKREWFAGMALQGLITHHAWNYQTREVAKAVSDIAFEVADAMLAEKEARDE